LVYVIMSQIGSRG